MTQTAAHLPVMLNEVIATLSPKDGEVYVDGTFGAGGYSRAILDSANCRVIGIDRDMSALDKANDMKEAYGDRLLLVHGAFGDVKSHLAELGFEKIDGFVLDIGVSSMQIDQPERGFSFRFDGPLDMRMDTSSGQSASEVVMQTKEDDLANLIYKYGEERLSRRIAKEIVKARAEMPIAQTAQLAEIVRACVPRSSKDGIDPATRTFQALRIAVNDELGELERALSAAPEILNEGGRLIVVSFHSLEDRIVKNTFKALTGRTSSASRHSLEVSPQDQIKPSFSAFNRKPILPTQDEIKVNARARSAKLRAVVKREGGA